MTHDTPNGSDERRRWCVSCELSVVPLTNEDSEVCPACKAELE